MISALIVEPLMAIIAAVLLIIAALKYSSEGLNKTLTSVAIAILFLSVIIGYVVAL